MKLRFKPHLLAALLGVALTTTLHAQTSAFTYQGRLLEGGSPANGTYNLMFTLYDSSNSPGTVVAGPITNSPVAVTNGLFTTTLDFGASVFDGSDRWLEIGVATNGSGVFTNLTPRQLISSTPYAIQAANAASAVSVSGSVAATQLTGTLSSNNFAAGSITAPMLANGAVGSAQLAPGTLAAPINIGSTSVVAVANSSYVLTNDAPTIIDLSQTPAQVGDVVRISGAGAGWLAMDTNDWTARETNRYWTSVASSADGTKLVAVDGAGHVNASGSAYTGGQIYTSTDSGVTWTPRESNRYWSSVASSADGSKLVAVVNGGQIYTSTDSGVNWTAQETNRYWLSVASSADGSKLVAVVFGGQIYTSTDSGVSWTPHETNNNWIRVASSTDGSKLVAVVIGGQIYTSTDFGVTWTPRESNRGWYAVASSADGSKLVAVVYGGQIYTSTDSGVNWTAQETNRYWYSVASSADGSKLAAVVYGGQIYTSPDSGATWFPVETNRYWHSVASSADGIHLVAVDGGTFGNGPDIFPNNGGKIYIGTLSGVIAQGVAGESATLQYFGNGLWKEVHPPVGLITGADIAAGSITAANLDSSALANLDSTNGLWTPNGVDVYRGTGNVGIGTSVPSQKLDVVGGAAFTGNVGIGTITPSNNLDVVGDASFSGNVGIGTGSPSQKLDVVGGAAFTGNVGIGTNNPSQKLDVVGGAAFSGNVGIGTIITPSNNLDVVGGATFTGNVGIGTTTPQAKLQVTGNVLANGVYQSTGSYQGGYAARLLSGGEGDSVSVKTENNGSTITVWDDNHGTFKSFVIPNPLDPKKYLVHVAIEGPEVAVYYRGSAQLKNGRAFVKLPHYFEALTHKHHRTVQLTDVDGFDRLAVRSQDGYPVRDGRFEVYSDNPHSTQRFDWEVMARRADDAGLVVEPNRADVIVHGDGPYTYLTTNPRLSATHAGLSRSESQSSRTTVARQPASAMEAQLARDDAKIAGLETRLSALEKRLNRLSLAQGTSQAQN